MKPINKWTEADVDELATKMDKFLLRLVQGTIILCGVMILFGIIYHILGYFPKVVDFL